MRWFAHTPCPISDGEGMGHQCMKRERKLSSLWERLSVPLPPSVPAGGLPASLSGFTVPASGFKGLSVPEPEPLLPPFWTGVVTVVPPAVVSPGFLCSSLVQATVPIRTVDSISAETLHAAARLTIRVAFIV